MENLLTCIKKDKFSASSEFFIDDTVHSPFLFLSFNYQFQSLGRYGLKSSLVKQRQFLCFGFNLIIIDNLSRSASLVS